MGAWGEDIMASDHALDELWAIKKTIRGEDPSDDDITREELNDHMEAIVEKRSGGWDGDTFWQVLAYQIVTLGANMHQEVRDNIDSATNEDVSDWSHPGIRLKYLAELREAVHKYVDGEPLELQEDIGLLNKIHLAIKEGRI